MIGRTGQQNREAEPSILPGKGKLTNGGLCAAAIRVARRTGPADLSPLKTKFGTQQFHKLIAVQAVKVICLFQLANTNRKAMHEVTRSNCSAVDDAGPSFSAAGIPIQAIEDLK